MVNIHYGLFFVLSVIVVVVGWFLLKRFRKVILWAGVIYSVTFVGFQIFLLQDHSTYDPAMDYDYMIVLGAGLEENQVMPVLEIRLLKALEVASEQKGAIILSGGLGSDEQRNESEAMAEFLVDHGIPLERLIEDDRSTSTWENLINSQELIEERQSSMGRVLVVSSNFHLPRVRLLARRLGIQMDTLGAEVSARDKLDDHSREYYAFLKSMLLDWTKRITIS